MIKSDTIFVAGRYCIDIVVNSKVDDCKMFGNLAYQNTFSAVYINRRIKCRDIMEAFKVHYADFLQLTKNCIYYDLQSILYSLVKLNVDPVIFTFLPNNKIL